MTSFDHDAGWVMLSGFLSSGAVAEVRAVCAQLLDLPPELQVAGDKPVAGTHHLMKLDERSDLVASVANDGRLLAVVAEILGTRFQPSQISYRSPQPTFGGQKLHGDDPPKLDGGPDSVATAIVALVDFTENNGTTRIVPGSHRRPDLQRQSGSLDSHPDEVKLTGPAGTAFVFSGHVLHSGTPNRSSTERPALQLVWRASR
ncbi:MAG: phytanoyl-CoA dioxygenase family protein [Acidimicrobiales bacterium]